MSNPKIAVIDRDPGFLAVLCKRLDAVGWSHRLARGRISPRRIAAMELDALIVDTGVVQPNRWPWLRQVRRGAPDLAIVVCTAGMTTADRVGALRLGADDLLSKPCHPEELIARVEAALRRVGSTASPSAQPVSAGEVEIRGAYSVSVAGAALSLTRREFQLLRLLVDSAGAVLERDSVYERLWGHMMTRDDRSVDVFVRKLRAKLEVASPQWRYIHTHRGVGYRFSAERLAVPIRPSLKREPVRSPQSSLAA